MINSLDSKAQRFEGEVCQENSDMFLARYILSLAVNFTLGVVETFPRV